MNRKMFCAGGCLHVVRIVALKSLHHCGAHSCRKVRIFSERLLSAAPSWIPVYVYVRSPERQPPVLPSVAGFYGDIVFCARLVRNRSRLLLGQSRIKRGRKTYRLGKNSRVSRPCDSVKTFVPPVVFRNSKPRNGHALVKHERHFLLKGHAVRHVSDFF